MNSEYRNEIADHGASLISHIGLLDENGSEISGGGYERQEVSWTTASDGTIRPTETLSFDVPADTTIGGWSGYDAQEDGTDYGGADIEEEHFTNEGVFELREDGTGILHTSSSS